MTFRAKLLAHLEKTWAGGNRGVGDPADMTRRVFPPPPPPVEIEGYQTALRGLTDPGYLGSQKHQEQQWRADRRDAHPDLLEFERAFLKRLERLKIPMFTHCLWRGPQEQINLFVDGKTKAKWGESPHNFGCAIDVIHARKGWSLAREQWSLLGHIGKEVSVQISVPIVWGGDWSFYDPAHWELKNWRGLNWARAETLEETFK